MNTRPRHLVALALLSLLGMLPGPRSADAYERNRVRITGRVVDRSGLPLRDTWVVTRGSRRTGTLVGASGRYTLDVPGATQFELSRNPLLLRVQARRKGWKLSMPGGAAELAIELRIVSDSLGGTRFQVRSNDPAVAAMLADDAVLQSGTQVALQLDFVGTRGIQVENDVVDMNATQEVVLNAPTRTAPPDLLANAGRIEDLAVGAAHDSPASDATEPARPRPLDPVSALLAQAKTARTADNAPVDDESGLNVAAQLSPPASETRAPRGAAKPARSGSKREPARPAGNVPPDSDLDPPVNVVPVMPPDNEPLEAARVNAEAATTRVADSTAHADQDSVDPPAPPAPDPGKRVRKPKASRVVRPAAVEDEASPTQDDLRREDEKPRVIRPGDPDAQAAEVEKRMRRKPRARPATTEEIRNALQLLGEPAPATPPASVPMPAVAEKRTPPAVDSSVVQKPAAEVAPPTADTNPPAATAPSASAPVAPPVTPPAPAADAPSDVAAAAPSKAPASSSQPATPPSGGSRGSNGCDCRIEGTVEVVSQNPLPERTQAMVWLADEPRTYTTVELFMGSPRQFELRGVTCKSHALKVTVRSKQRFMMSSPVVVDCSGGGYHQAKIVLEPLQKKR